MAGRHLSAVFSAQLRPHGKLTACHTPNPALCCYCHPSQVATFERELPGLVLHTTIGLSLLVGFYLELVEDEADTETRTGTGSPPSRVTRARAKKAE